MHPKVTVAREVAYDAFTLVMENKMAPDEATEYLIKKYQLSLRKLDRSFVKEVLFGGLRWFSKIYWIIQNTSDRNLDQTTPQIRAALVLGTYQIFYMDRVPDRAAVNESVEYIKKKGQAGAVSFVNGILRSIARRAEYFTKPDKDKTPADYLSLQYAHPKWMVERWLRRFTFDRLKDMLSSNNQPPPISIRLNAKKVHLDDVQSFRSVFLRDEKVHSDRRPLRSCLSLQESPELGEGSYFQQGYYTIQDEASQLIPLLLDLQKGQLIVDACSAPGGKLTHIHEIVEGQAEIYAVERQKKKIDKIKDNFQRLGHTLPHLIEKDFLEFSLDGRLADRILLDAPCSGLGVLRRHPEGKWHKRPEIVSEMAQIQRKLLEHAISLLKPGGQMVFSVCSFEEEETLGHIDWLQKERSSLVELIAPLTYLPDYYKKFVTRENCLLIFSGNKDNMDGFGAFVLKKR